MKRSVAHRVTEIWHVFTGCHHDIPYGAKLSDFDLDSLARMELLIELETEFEIRIGEDMEDRLAAMTLPQMIEFIESKKRGRP